MKITIYGLHCPLAGYVKYVGKAVNVLYRFNRHIGPNELAKEETHKTRWIRKLLSLGLSPELVILEETDDEHWAERERWWIAHLRGQGFVLTNSTDGGEAGTPAGSKRPPEHCKRISEGMKGKKYPPERCANISAALKGKKQTPERRAAHAARQKERGAKMTPDQKKEMASHFAGYDEKRRMAQAAARRPGMTKHKVGASRFIGVSFNSRPGRQKRWTARVPGSPMYGVEPIYAGYYHTEIEAAIAYNKAVEKSGRNLPLNAVVEASN